MPEHSSTNSRPARPPSVSAPASVAGALVPGASERRLRRAPLVPPPADRLLVIRLGALGDVVRTLPAVAALRTAYPGAHLTWLVEPAAAGVVGAARIVDETLVFPRADLVDALRAGDALSFFRGVRGFTRQLRRRRFEIVLDFHGLAKSAIFARLSGAPLRVGYDRHGAREFAHLLMNRRVSLPSAPVSRFDRNAALVHGLVPGLGIPDEIRLDPTDLAIARLSARLRVSGRDRASNFVLIHPGASRGARHKRYPVAGWARVCQMLADAGLAVWLAAGTGRDEHHLVDRILRESRGAAVPAPETRSFDDLLALLARASVFVSGDTGPLHAASIHGVPVVQLLGPTDPVHNEPFRGTPSRRLHVPLACSPCRKGCAAASCMRTISPGAVAEAVLELHAQSVKGAEALGLAGARFDSAAPGRGDPAGGRPDPRA